MKFQPPRKHETITREKLLSIMRARQVAYQEQIEKDKREYEETMIKWNHGIKERLNALIPDFRRGVVNTEPWDRSEDFELCIELLENLKSEEVTPRLLAALNRLLHISVTYD